VGGGTQGIGRAAAEALAALGADVVVLARNPGGRFPVIEADTAAPEAVVELVRHEIAARGPFTILINNTGGPAGGPIVEARPEQFVATFTSHLLTASALTQLVLPGMQQAGYGRIVNVISTSVKAPIPGLGVSNTIRAAVASWAKTLSGEVGRHGITVNNVLPGMTRTGRLDSIIRSRAEREAVPIEQVERQLIAEIPLGRFGDPSEVGAAIAFLCSPAASYISGINLPVDGGRTVCL
jgi:3-oxoacyl-[acyl-carrier protein] reductase